MSDPTTEPEGITIVLSPDVVPPRPANVDEEIVVIVLRREDPANPDGSAQPDLPSYDDPTSLDLTAKIVAAVEESPFSSELSYITQAGTTDVEGQGGAISIASLRDLLASPPVPGSEPEPEPEG